MQIQVLFFAHFKEKTGNQAVTLELPTELTVAGLKQTLAQRFPAVAPLLQNSVVSVNREFSFDEDRIPDGAEVGIFPPVSGGSGSPTVLRITSELLDLNDLVRQVTLETTGAVAVFTGVVRGSTLERLYRDIRSLRIYEGATEVQKLIIARAISQPQRG